VYTFARILLPEYCILSSEVRGLPCRLLVKCRWNRGGPHVHTLLSLFIGSLYWREVVAKFGQKRQILAPKIGNFWVTSIHHPSIPQCGHDPKARSEQIFVYVRFFSLPTKNVQLCPSNCTLFPLQSGRQGMPDDFRWLPICLRPPVSTMIADTAIATTLPKPNQ